MELFQAVGAALLALFALVRGNLKGYASHAIAGLLVSAVVLVKLSSIPLVLMAIAAAVIILLRAGAGERRAAIGRSAVLLLVAGVPIIAWVLRNALVQRILFDPNDSCIFSCFRFKLLINLRLKGTSIYYAFLDRTLSGAMH